MRYVLVTGANGGLGKNLINRLALNDYYVFACDLLFENKVEGNIHYINLDVTSDESINKAKEIVLSICDKIYSVINLAGIFYLDSIVEGSEAKLRKIIEVNFFGTYKVNKIFTDIIERKKGRIINMSSEIGRNSMVAFNGYYGLSKRLLDTYTDSLRRELILMDIQVTKIRAGSFKTNMLNGANEEFDRLISETKNFKKILTKFKPLMLNELNKTNSPDKFSKLVLKILKKKKVKIHYNICNSKLLKLLSSLPEKLQDYIYTKFGK